MNVIARYPITPADDNDRSVMSHAEQHSRYMGHEALKLLIQTAESALKHQFGNGLLGMNPYASEALLKTEADVKLAEYIDELKVALTIMEVQMEGLGI